SPSEAEDAAAGVVQTQDCPDLPAKLNVLGHTRLEAVERVEGYLAEASAVGRTQVRVLHGKGEGVLQQAIWVALRRNSRVARFRFAELSEGGTGVTIVDLKTGQQ
ncbi:MAG: Smr/MutS family protein, partial [bacterium]